MTDTSSSWDAILKSIPAIPDSDNSQAKARFLQKQNEIKQKFEAAPKTMSVVYAEGAKKELAFFHERYTVNLQAEKKAEAARAFSPPVGVPLLPRLYYAVSGLINNGLKGAAFGFKKQARDYAADKDKANIDFQQVQDELSYFKQTQLPQNMGDKEEQAWKKVSDFVTRKELENKKWGINPDKFEKDLAKNLKGFVGKVREDERFAQALVDQGSVKSEDMAPLSPEKIKYNQRISESVSNLIGYFKENNSFRRDVAKQENNKNTSDKSLTSQMGKFMNITQDRKVQLPPEKTSPVMSDLRNNFTEQRKKSEKNEVPSENKNKVVNKKNTPKV